MSPPVTDLDMVGSTGMDLSSPVADLDTAVGERADASAMASSLFVVLFLSPPLANLVVDAGAGSLPPPSANLAADAGASDLASSCASVREGVTPGYVVRGLAFRPPVILALKTM